MKSKFNLSRFFNIFLVLFGVIVLGLFTNKIFHKIYLKGVNIGDCILIVFFLFLIIIAIGHLNGIKYILIKEQKLLYFSLLNPFGKNLYYKDYAGIFKIKENAISGSYDVFYFINHEKFTKFKIMGLYYSNIDEVIKEIPLPDVKRNLSSKKYLKLLFTGKIKLD